MLMQACDQLCRSLPRLIMCVSVWERVWVATSSYPSVSRTPSRFWSNSFADSGLRCRTVNVPLQRGARLHHRRGVREQVTSLCNCPPRRVDFRLLGVNWTSRFLEGLLKQPGLGICCWQTLEEPSASGRCCVMNSRRSAHLLRSLLVCCIPYNKFISDKPTITQ